MKERTRDLPSRPSLPPLFFAALSAWIAIIIAESTSWKVHCGELHLSWIACVFVAFILAATLVLLVIARRKRNVDQLLSPRVDMSGAAVILVSFACAFICGQLYWMSWENDAEHLARAAPEKESTLELTGDPGERDYGIVSGANLHMPSHAVEIRLMWPSGAAPLFAGHKVVVSGSMKTPGTDDAGRWAHRNGIAGTLNAKSVEDAGSSDSLRGLVCGLRDSTFERIETMQGDGAGVLAGMLIGNKTLYAGTQVEQAFRTTGLAHLMAVSGTHLAIVTMLLTILLSKTKAKRWLRSIVIIAVMIVYISLTGFAASAMRAAVMCAVAMLLGSVRKRKHVLSSLSLCTFAFLCMDPSMAFSMSFQLSVLSVFGLVVFGNLIGSWTAHVFQRLPDAASSSIAATLAASGMTLPVTIPAFAQLPLISPLSNLIAAPLVTVSLCMGIIGIVVGAAVPLLGSMMLGAACMVCNLCAWIVSSLARLPFACIPLSGDTTVLAFLFATFFIIVWLIWPLPKIEKHPVSERVALRRLTTTSCACLAMALPLAIPMLFGLGSVTGPGTSSDSQIVMLDVGQGDGMLIKSKGSCMLIDTGQDSDVLLKELAEQGVTHLDAVMLTHKDADHTGALEGLSGVVAIDHVYVHADLLDANFERKVIEAARWATSGKGVEGVRPGTRLSIGRFTLTVLAPDDGGESGNDDSIISLVEFDGGYEGSRCMRGILTGDAESKAMQQVVHDVGDVDFLKVAHHGSKGGLTRDEMERLDPEIALISVGADNRYGHPSAETLDMLEEQEARIYRTDEMGAITLGFDEKGITVATEKTAA